LGVDCLKSDNKQIVRLAKAAYLTADNDGKNALEKYDEIFRTNIEPQYYKKAMNILKRYIESVE
jgi:hypothetical protein